MSSVGEAAERRGRDPETESNSDRRARAPSRGRAARPSRGRGLAVWTQREERTLRRIPRTGRRRRSGFRLKTAVLLLLAAAAAAEESERPKIGLALGGGGAKGGAHVGVLEVLEELNVPVDYIAGTSIGAIVGGLYATGMSAAEIRAGDHRGQLGKRSWRTNRRDAISNVPPQGGGQPLPVQRWRSASAAAG